MTIEELAKALADSGTEHAIEDLTTTTWRPEHPGFKSAGISQHREITVKRRVKPLGTGWQDVGTLTLNEDGSIRRIIVHPDVPFNVVAPVLRGLA